MKKNKMEDARRISTSRLNTLLCVYLMPIDLVIYQGSSVPLLEGMTHLEGGFVLRCFQRLSLPNVATQPCHWRDNWYTRGSFTPVLSY